MKSFFTCVILMLFSFGSFASEDYIQDTISSKVLHKKVSVADFLKETKSLLHTEDKKFRVLIQELFQYAEKSKNEKLRGHAYHLLGSYYESNLKMDSSLIAMGNALAIQKVIGDSSGLISTYFGYGNHYDIKGLSDSTLHYYFKALDIAEKINDSLRIGYAFMGVGNVYSKSKAPENAKELYQKSLIYFAATSKIAMSWVYNNLGEVYESQDSINKAVELYEKSIVIKREENDWYGILFSYNNIGDILLEQEDKPEEALTYYFQSLRAGQEAKIEKEQICVPYLKIGKAYLAMKKYDLAMNYQDSSFQIAKDLNSFNLIAHNYLLQSEIYKGKKAFEKANEALSQYLLYNDSLLSEKSLQQVNQLSAKYENEKKELEISNLEKDKKAQQAAIKQKDAENLMYLVGLGLAILLIVFVSVAFLQKRKANLFINKQKDEIQDQKEIVEEKNNEITDSIKYAKRIQSAILPPDKLVKEYLQESFILYKPKDIVAGDFYWMEQVASSGINGDKKILFAAADCTGHGVPGAMVSVVCNNALNRSVREYGLTDPGQILDKTREIVIQEFEKSDEEVMDGMDIALCSLNGNILEYAGANNPLWILRNGEIIVVKADKQPIGKFRAELPFTTHTIELQKGDAVYLFSDGYADQFGGEKGKKMKSVNFKQLLLSLQDKNMIQQKESIDIAFETWRGNLEQIDDVCVIGLRI